MRRLNIDNGRRFKCLPSPSVSSPFTSSNNVHTEFVSPLALACKCPEISLFIPPLNLQTNFSSSEHLNQICVNRTFCSSEFSAKWTLGFAESHKIVKIKVYRSWYMPHAAYSKKRNWNEPNCRWCFPTPQVFSTLRGIASSPCLSILCDLWWKWCKVRACGMNNNTVKMFLGENWFSATVCFKTEQMSTFLSQFF